MLPGLIAQVRSLYPALDEDAAPDALLAAWYPQVLALAGTDWHDPETQLARAHLLAHVAISMDITGVLGSLRADVSSVRTGRRAVSYGQQVTRAVTLDDAGLMQTIAGRAYLALRDASPATAPFVL